MGVVVVMVMMVVMVVMDAGDILKFRLCSDLKKSEF